MSEKKPYHALVVGALITGAVGLGYKLLEKPIDLWLNPVPVISVEERQAARVLASQAAAALLEDHRTTRTAARNLLVALGADSTGEPRRDYRLDADQSMTLQLLTAGAPKHERIPYERICTVLGDLAARAYENAFNRIEVQNSANVLMRGYRWPSENWNPLPKSQDARQVTIATSRNIPEDSAKIELVARFLTRIVRNDSVLVAARNEECLPPDRTIRVPL
ncbi:MAG TPA: hypothetical protein VE871_14775 [Longimicrobium sp.]|nr:hypothetical protein [Longimicrobium sp.]